MPEETTAIDYVMEKSTGPHFSGLRIDGLLSSPRLSAAASSSSPSFSTADSTHKQPFVIGVSGGTASGKTTVCDMIIQQLHDQPVVLVNQGNHQAGELTAFLSLDNPPGQQKHAFSILCEVEDSESKE